MNTQPTQWPDYFPPYHTPKGWKVEKLQAEITLREHYAGVWNLKLHAAMGTKEFYPLFDKIQVNYATLLSLYDKRHAICRSYIGLC